MLKKLFGAEDHLTARAIQAAIGGAIPVLVAQLGRRIFGWPVGLLAAAVLCVYLPLIYFGRLLMTETLYTFLLIGALCLTPQPWEMRRMAALLCGAVFGLACLTRGILLGFAPVLLLWSWLMGQPKRSGLVTATWIAIGILATITPWTIRNYYIHNAFIPIATKGSWNLYFYNYPIPNYDFNERWSDIQIPAVNDLSEVERRKEYAQQAIGFMGDYPTLIASFAIRKLVDFWNPLLKNERKAFSILNVASYGIMTVLAFAGLFRRIQQRSLHPFIILLWLLIAYYTLQAMIFTGGGKARLPIEPLLVLLGSEGLRILLITGQRDASKHRFAVGQLIKNVIFEGERIRR
jgi:4-amino-4-deoxy-L-arabinose transferase-like glycosyltransferase